MTSTNKLAQFSRQLVSENHTSIEHSLILILPPLRQVSMLQKTCQSLLFRTQLWATPA